jgi:hypothetical protein
MPHLLRVDILITDAQPNVQRIMGNTNALAAGYDRAMTQLRCSQECQPTVGNTHRRVDGGTQHHIIAPGYHPNE